MERKCPVEVGKRGKQIFSKSFQKEHFDFEILDSETLREYGHIILNH
jgi:hypothetical protein